MSKEKIEYEIGSGNVYKDLGFHNPEAMQAKAHLVFKILDTITERNLTLDKAAEILRIQDLRSFHNLMKNYDENGVIFSIFSVPARLQSTPTVGCVSLVMFPLTIYYLNIRLLGSSELKFYFMLQLTAERTI